MVELSDETMKWDLNHPIYELFCMHKGNCFVFQHVSHDWEMKNTMLMTNEENFPSFFFFFLSFLVSYDMLSCTNIYNFQVLNNLTEVAGT